MLGRRLASEGALRTYRRVGSHSPRCPAGTARGAGGTASPDPAGLGPAAG
jgi:hypothetical protein